MSTSPLLSARDVHRDYARSGTPVHAVRGVSLDVASGEYVAIVGPSGCGKSTLLNLLGAIDRPTACSVSIDNVVVSNLPDGDATRFRLARIGFVFQRFYLLPILSASENIELPMAEAGVSAGERRERARELLGYVGLRDRADHRPSELSGGEQQRVAIARALANRLLEPLNGLKVVVQDVRPGLHDRQQRRVRAVEIGNQHLHAHARALTP